jgi:hypothetical protein
MRGGRREMKFLAVPIAAVLALCGLSACPDVAVRDQKIYKVEIQFMEQSALQQATELALWVKSSCCEEGAIKDDESCKKRAKLVQVITTRVPYHRDMMYFLGGLTEKRPPKEVPTVPPIDELCKEN